MFISIQEESEDEKMGISGSFGGAGVSGGTGAIDFLVTDDPELEMESSGIWAIICAVWVIQWIG